MKQLLIIGLCAGFDDVMCSGACPVRSRLLKQAVGMRRIREGTGDTGVGDLLPGEYRVALRYLKYMRARRYTLVRELFAEGECV